MTRRGSMGMSPYRYGNSMIAIEFAGASAAARSGIVVAQRQSGVSETLRLVSDGDIMKIYQRRSAQPMKWFLAFVLFCLVLGWTMSDVYGINVKQSPTQGGDSSVSDGTQQVGQEHTPTDADPSPAVPEPSTLLLLAVRLGGGALLLRRKKS